MLKAKSEKTFTILALYQRDILTQLKAKEALRWLLQTKTWFLRIWCEWLPRYLLIIHRNLFVKEKRLGNKTHSTPINRPPRKEEEEDEEEEEEEEEEHTVTSEEEVNPFVEYLRILHVGFLLLAFNGVLKQRQGKEALNLRKQMKLKNENCVAQRGGGIGLREKALKDGLNIKDSMEVKSQVRVQKPLTQSKPIKRPPRKKEEGEEEEEELTQRREETNLVVVKDNLVQSYSEPSEYRKMGGELGLGIP